MERTIELRSRCHIYDSSEENELSVSKNKRTCAFAELLCVVFFFFGFGLQSINTESLTDDSFSQQFMSSNALEWETHTHTRSGWEIETTLIVIYILSSAMHKCIQFKMCVCVYDGFTMINDELCSIINNNYSNLKRFNDNCQPNKIGRNIVFALRNRYIENRNQWIVFFFH